MGVCRMWTGLSVRGAFLVVCAIACGSKVGAVQGDGGDACAIGCEGCACTDNGVCDPGLQCRSDLCVAVAGDTSTTANDDGGFMPTDSSGGSAGSWSSGDGTSGDDTSDGGMSDGGSPDSSGTTSGSTAGSDDGGTTSGDPVDPSGIIYLNFDGVTLSSGTDDARANTTQISQLAGSLAAYGVGPKRDAAIEAAKHDWKRFNVLVTGQRPASGDYTMVVLTPTNPFGSGVNGIAPIDCDNANVNNIAFVFGSVNDARSANATAASASREAAHSFGLENVSHPGEIMDPLVGAPDPEFIDQCTSVSGGAMCGAQHMAACGSSSQQNSVVELLTLFGAP